MITLYERTYIIYVTYTVLYLFNLIYSNSFPVRHIKFENSVRYIHSKIYYKLLFLLLNTHFCRFIMNASCIIT